MEVIEFNCNRKNNNLQLFEFGKTYKKISKDTYSELMHLCVYITGSLNELTWKQKNIAPDIYYIKGVAQAILSLLGLKNITFKPAQAQHLQNGLHGFAGDEKILEIGQAESTLSARFNCKQPVFFADVYWDVLMEYTKGLDIRLKEVPKYPAVERDLSIIVPVDMKYEKINEQVRKLQLSKLQDVKLFDVFESEKLGSDKKSFAINFTFSDDDKTLTDKEIDSWMSRIMNTFEKELNAEIRK
jgi:phenylalanyl-tRNA synthetase beta chain